MLTHLIFTSCYLFFSSSHGQEYNSYYGEIFINYLNATLNSDHGFSPLKIVLSAIDDNFSVDNQCRTELIRFKESLQRLEPWSVRMADAWGGPQAGALSGNLINLGSWDQCNVVGDELRGRYCFLKISLDGENPQNISYVPRNTPILNALCVPHDCGSMDLNSLLSKATATLIPGGSTIVTCSPDAPSWGAWEITGAVFFSVIFLVMGLSTAYDVFWALDYKGCNGLFCSFSIRKNLAALSETKQTSFSCLDGMRTISQLGVITYHIWRNILKNSVPVFNKFSLNEMLRSLDYAYLVNMPFVVDTFFVISGFLTMYSLLSKRGENTPIWMHIFNRVMRVYPAYILVFFLESTLTGKICDGPLCSDFIYSKQEKCRKYWWTSLLLIHNIYPGIEYSCTPPSWFVATDFQTYAIFVPLIIYGLRKSKRATIWGIVAVAICSMVAVFLQVALMNLGTDTLAVDNVARELVFMNSLYTQVHCRLASWCVGLLFAAFMQNKKKNKIALKKGQVIIIYALVGLTMLSVILINVPPQKDGYEYNNIESALFNAFSKPIWSLGICWVIFSCCYGYAGFINSFLSSIPFQLLGKISYSTYMIHQLVINLYFSGLRAPVSLLTLHQRRSDWHKNRQYLNDPRQRRSSAKHLANLCTNIFTSLNRIKASLVSGLIANCFLAGIVLYLIAESPVANMWKFVLAIRKSKSIPTAHHSERNGQDVEPNNDMQLTNTNSPHC